MLFGSGTKPFVAAAVLQQVDAGKLRLDSKVAEVIDAGLRRANGTTLGGLFGAQAANVTVSHLLHMQSGLVDFDVPSLDDKILTESGADWPPYAVLRAAASQSPTFHCAPGECTESSNLLSASLSVAGLRWPSLTFADLR